LVDLKATRPTDGLDIIVAVKIRQQRFVAAAAQQSQQSWTTS